MVQLSGFNWVDIIIVTIVALSCIFGLWRGLVREVLSLVTWVAALIVARVYSDDLAPLFSGTFDGETTRLIAAFSLLFVATLVVGALINHLMSKLLSIAGLKLTDRLLGGAFGIARGGLIIMLCIFIAREYLSDSPSWRDSALIPYGEAGIVWSRIFIDELSESDLAADVLSGNEQ